MVRKKNLRRKHGPSRAAPWRKVANALGPLAKGTGKSLTKLHGDPTGLENDVAWNSIPITVGEGRVAWKTSVHPQHFFKIRKDGGVLSKRKVISNHKRNIWGKRSNYQGVGTGRWLQQRARGHVMWATYSGVNKRPSRTISAVSLHKGPKVLLEYHGDTLFNTYIL